MVQPPAFNLMEEYSYELRVGMSVNLKFINGINGCSVSVSIMVITLVHFTRGNSNIDCVIFHFMEISKIKKRFCVYIYLSYLVFL